MQTKPRKPELVVAMLTAMAASMADGSPMIERAKDGREVLLRGPRPATLTDVLDPPPAVRRAYAENTLVVLLTARQWLTVAMGGVVETVTATTAHVSPLPVQVRLATWTEAMLFNRAAIAAVDAMMAHVPGWEGPPPMDQEQARRLVTPVEIPHQVFEELVAKFDGVGVTQGMRAAMAAYGHQPRSTRRSKRGNKTGGALCE